LSPYTNIGYDNKIDFSLKNQPFTFEFLDVLYIVVLAKSFI